MRGGRGCRWMVLSRSNEDNEQICGNENVILMTLEMGKKVFGNACIAAMAKGLASGFSIQPIN